MHNSIYRPTHPPTELILSRHTQDVDTNGDLIYVHPKALCDCAVSKATITRATTAQLISIGSGLKEKLVISWARKIYRLGGSKITLGSMGMMMKCSGKGNCTVGLFVPASKTFDSYFWAARPAGWRTYFNSSSRLFAERTP